MNETSQAKNGTSSGVRRLLNGVKNGGAVIWKTVAVTLMAMLAGLAGFVLIHTQQPAHDVTAAHLLQIRAEVIELKEELRNFRAHTKELSEALVKVDRTLAVLDARTDDRFRKGGSSVETAGEMEQLIRHLDERLERLERDG